MSRGTAKKPVRPPDRYGTFGISMDDQGIEFPVSPPFNYLLILLNKAGAEGGYSVSDIISH